MKVFYLHFNRIAMQRKDPKVWSIRTSKGCFHAEKIVCKVPLETIYKPDSKSNPRAFFKGFGNGFWTTDADGNEVLLMTDDMETWWASLTNKERQGYFKMTPAQQNRWFVHGQKPKALMNV